MLCYVMLRGEREGMYYMECHWLQFSATKLLGHQATSKCQIDFWAKLAKKV